MAALCVSALLRNWYSTETTHSSAVASVHCVHVSDDLAAEPLRHRSQRATGRRRPELAGREADTYPSTSGAAGRSTSRPASAVRIQGILGFHFGAFRERRGFAQKLNGEMTKERAQRRRQGRTTRRR